LAKFDASTPGEAFTALHNLISFPVGTDDFTTIIALGDYIDLPSLTIGGTTINDVDLTPHGRLLRLMVVGINSFQANGSYTGVSGAPNHVVFQFQNVPINHEMNPYNDNTTGYLNSSMRTWLTASFLPGLKAATGLTDTVLWAPARKVANKGSGADGTHDITDTLWLPTEWEMHGSNDRSSSAHETAANQARLEYYPAGNSGDTSRLKYTSDDTSGSYWMASPYYGSAAAFCSVNSLGNAHLFAASSVGGCAPAFCVR
jgi:hypothetical protein